MIRNTLRDLCQVEGQDLSPLRNDYEACELAEKGRADHHEIYARMTIRDVRVASKYFFNFKFVMLFLFIYKLCFRKK